MSAVHEVLQSEVVLQIDGLPLFHYICCLQNPSGCAARHAQGLAGGFCCSWHGTVGGGPVLLSREPHASAVVTGSHLDDVALRLVLVLLAFLTAFCACLKVLHSCCGVVVL